MSQKHWDQLKKLKNAKKTQQVFIITLNNELYYSENNNLVVFENEKWAYDYIKLKDYRLGDWSYICKWLNNVNVY